MHPNPIFRKAENIQNIDFARHRGFGTLTINGVDGPLLSHIPFLLSQDGQHLEAHMVRSNPLWKALDKPQNAAVAVNGNDSYVSPDWYGIDDQVPTWNYVAIHLRGELCRLPDDELPNHLRRLSHQFEKQLLPKPIWQIDKVDDQVLSRMIRMIAPVAMEVSSIDGTWKLGQNKPEAARLAAAKNVASNGIGSEVSQIAGLMKNPPC